MDTMNAELQRLRDSFWNLFGTAFVTAAVLLATTLAGCSHVQFVATYDVKTFDETIRIGKDVDLFYAKLLELKESDRTYDKSAQQYAEIGADLRSLSRRNLARPLNEQSITQSKNILTFWQKYHEAHKEKKAYPAARFDRERFNRLFDAAALAEAAKRLTAEDTKPD